MNTRQAKNRTGRRDRFETDGRDQTRQDNRNIIIGVSQDYPKTRQSHKIKKTRQITANHNMCHKIVIARQSQDKRRQDCHRKTISRQKKTRLSSQDNLKTKEDKRINHKTVIRRSQCKTRLKGLRSGIGLGLCLGLG
jgi:hypothetical protein